MYAVPVGRHVGALFVVLPGDEDIEYVFRDARKGLDSFAVEAEDVIRALESLAQQGVARVLNTAGRGVCEALEEVAALAWGEECGRGFSVAGEGCQPCCPDASQGTLEPCVVLRTDLASGLSGVGVFALSWFEDAYVRVLV